MDLQLTCPACAAAFARAADMRGKKICCPKCNASLIVTSAGVAKADEQRRPALAQPVPARRWHPLWFLLAVPLLLLPVCGGLPVYLLTRGHTEERKEIAKNDRGQAQPAPPKVQQWEYKVVALDPLRIPGTLPNISSVEQADAFSDHFNKLGQDGWEYHDMLIFPRFAGGGVTYVLFKRPKRSGQ
jgi:hypothetical protein